MVIRGILINPGLIIILLCNYYALCQNTNTLNSLYESKNHFGLEKHLDSLHEAQQFNLPKEYDSLTEIATLLCEEIVLESYELNMASRYMGGQYKTKYLLLQCRVPYFMTDTFPNFENIQTRSGIQEHYGDFVMPVQKDTLIFYPSPLIPDQFFLYLTEDFENELSEFMGRKNYDECSTSDSKRKFLLQDSLIQPFYYKESGQVDCDNRFWTFVQQPMLICIIFSKDLNRVQLYSVLHDNEVIITLFEREYGEFSVIKQNSACYNCD